MFGFGKKKQETSREMIINAEHMETRVAILENGLIEEFKVEHPSDKRIVGSVYKGTIQNLEEGLRAAFVDIGLKKNAFIHYWDMIPEDSSRPDIEEAEPDKAGGKGKGRGRGRGNGRGKGRTPRRKKRTHQEIKKLFPVGSEIVVQVSKGPIGTKGPRVTANISIPGRYLVLLPGSTLQGISRKIENAKERQRLKKILARLPVPEGAGLIMRTVADGVNQRSIARDMRALVAIWEKLQERMVDKNAPSRVYEEPDLVERVARDWLTEDIDRIVVDSREEFENIREIAKMFGRRIRSRIQHYEGTASIYEHFDIERKIEESMRRKVMLKSGGHIVFEETEAMITVDVNTGRHRARSQEDTILEVNLESVEEVARQLRLRNVGGLVMLDLIDMSQRKHQNAVYRAFKDALKRDRARTNVLPISKLGVLEMSRQRVGESIVSTMYTDCPYCSGRGRVQSPLCMSIDIQRQIAAMVRKYKKEDEELKLQIIVHPSILERFKSQDEDTLVQLESQVEGHLSFRSDASLHHESFSILNAESGDVLYKSEK